MPSYDTRRTADYSPLVVHFTKDGPFMRPDLVVQGDPLFEFKHSTALDRLMSILRNKVIRSSPMPWLPNNPRSVCFTECIWDALVPLSEVYSPYGLVFSKHLVFERGGGPALYLRGDHLKHLIETRSIPSTLEPFIQPFDPKEVIRSGVKIDYLHEREWRLPTELSFEYGNLEYVLVKSLEDATSVVRTIGSQSLPEKKLIPLDTYEEIQRAWGKE